LARPARLHDQIIVLRHECKKEVARVRAPECGDSETGARDEKDGKMDCDVG